MRCDFGPEGHGLEIEFWGDGQGHERTARHPLDIDKPCPHCGKRLRRATGPFGGTARAPQDWRSWRYCPACHWSERDGDAK